MEALKRKTVDDLWLEPDERVELIDGEIVSTGHERKDTLQLFLLLQRHRVPFYWLIWPEDRTLIAYQLEDGGYKVIRTITGDSIAERPRVRVPPFDEAELDLGYILGD